jgi:hypothetical protein
LFLQLRHPPVRLLQLIIEVSNDPARLLQGAKLGHGYRRGTHQFRDLILTTIKMFKRN